MRVVFDNNVIVSAALIKGSVPFRAFAKAKNTEEIKILRSEQGLIELLKTLYKPKFARYFENSDKREELIVSFVNSSLDIEIKHKITACRDPKDNKFLELAISGQADFIISGDQDLLVLHPFENIPVISPADFLNLDS
jgi:putative PIN family toxin of toxin-antitoxin system